MIYVEFIKNFHLADMNNVMAVWLILTSWAQKYLILADSKQLLSVRLISASLTQKRLIPSI